MEITWFGHSTFQITTGGANLLIDPFFVGNPSSPVTHEEIAACDLILVTHDHSDHIGQACELAVKHDAEVVAMFDIIQNLIMQGLPQHLGVAMNIGGTVMRLGISIKMVQAMHSSVNGSPAGYILTFPDGMCIYNSGDTGLFSDMELFGSLHDIDIAMLPIGGRFTMDEQQAAYACKLLKCRQVIPHHWGTWSILGQGTEEMAAQLARFSPETQMVELSIGNAWTCCARRAGLQ